MNSAQAVRSLVRLALEDIDGEKNDRRKFRSVEDDITKSLGPSPARSMTINNTPKHVASIWSGKARRK